MGQARVVRQCDEPEAIIDTIRSRRLRAQSTHQYWISRPFPSPRAETERTPGQHRSLRLRRCMSSQCKSRDARAVQTTRTVFSLNINPQMYRRSLPVVQPLAGAIGSSLRRTRRRRRYGPHGDPRVGVVMVTDTLNSGGAERMVVGIASHLPVERFDVRICVTRSADGPLAAEARAAGLQIIELHRTGTRDVLPFSRLVEVMRADRVQILHGHMFGSNLWSSVVGALAGVPAVVAHEQTWSYEGQPGRQLIDGHVIGRAVDAYIAVSARDRERMIRLEGVPAEKITVIPNAYVPRRPGAVQPIGDWRLQLGVDADVPVIATVCMMRPQKALDVLLEAMTTVHRERPDVQLVVGGTGPELDRLKSVTSHLGIDDARPFSGGT